MRITWGAAKTALWTSRAEPRHDGAVCELLMLVQDMRLDPLRRLSASGLIVWPGLCAKALLGAQLRWRGSALSAPKQLVKKIACISANTAIVSYHSAFTIV